MPSTGPVWVVLAGAIAGPTSSGMPSNPTSPAVLVAVVVVAADDVFADATLDAVALDELLLELAPHAANAAAAATAATAASVHVIRTRIARHRSLNGVCVPLITCPPWKAKPRPAACR